MFSLAKLLEKGLIGDNIKKASLIYKLIGENQES
jgi:hypothetical protein